MMRRRERGFALLIVLWGLVPLSLLFTIMASSARSDVQLAANLRGAAAAEAAADGTIYAAVFDLLGGGAASGVTVRPLTGQVNPNLAQPALLAAMLVRLGADPRQADNLAAAIVDWRTPGQRASPHGAKAAEYRAAGLPYGPPGAPFESLDELRDVLGMPPRLLALLRPHLTLYTEGEPDPATAGPLVRGALRDIGQVGRGGSPVRVVRITATSGAAGIQITRSAVVRLGANAGGRGWRVLNWQDGDEESLNEK